MANNYQNIYQYIKTLEIIDTHEHLPPSHSVDIARNLDFFQEYLIHYFSCDLVSAGLSLKELEFMRNSKYSFSERWKLVEPYWESARFTGYGRALDIAVRDLYGYDKINKKNIENIAKAFNNAKKTDRYQKVLKEKSQITTSLIPFEPHFTNYDETFVHKVSQLDSFISIISPNRIKDTATQSNKTINSFDDWLSICKETIEKNIDNGVTNFKCGLAYNRTLKFKRRTKAQAEKIFNKINSSVNLHLSSRATYLTFKINHLEDYMLHYILDILNKKSNITYQFHTGLQEGNGNFIDNSNPSLMTNLFLEYTNIKFDIFHIAYPFQNVLSALAKNFQNVFIDMCWAHIISPIASQNALSQWLDSVPTNKISAFGGDYCFVDGVYAHQYIARENVSKVLAEKVDIGIFNLEEAKLIAKKLFIDNPKNIFNLA